MVLDALILMKNRHVNFLPVMFLRGDGPTVRLLHHSTRPIRRI